MPFIQNTATNQNKPKINEHGIWVNSLEWRPDGKVLAIGYNKNVSKLNLDDYFGSMISLVDVENSEVFKTIEIQEGEVNYLTWYEFQNSADSCKPFIYGCSPTVIEFLPKMVPINKSYEDKNEMPNYLFTNAQAVAQRHNKLVDENFEDILKISNQKSLNVLAAGTKNGFVNLYLFGIYKSCTIEVPNNPTINHLSFIDDLGYLNVVWEMVNDSKHQQQKNNISTYKIDTLKRNQEHYLVVSTIYCKLKSLIQYLNDSIQTMYEIFESILLEIDNKLSNYLLKNQREKDKRNHDVLLADEFLELLVFGNATHTLEKFLHDFFHKGLKKLGQSIETAYANIQKLVVVNLQRVTQHIFSYLHTLRAISQWRTEFHELEIDTNFVNDALRSVGSFYLKTVEFQQVIDISIRNVKCFFKWLYSVMLRVCGDSVPPSQQDFAKISQQELQFVADFIQENFEKEDEVVNTPDDTSDFFTDLTKESRTEAEDELRPTASNFTLERVGQYLKEENLLFISPSLNDLTDNLWIIYMEKSKKINQNLKESAILAYPHNSKSSLIQEYKQLEKKIDSIFENSFEKFCSKLPAQTSQLLNVNTLINECSELPKFTSSLNYLAFVDKNTFYLLNYNLKKEKIEAVCLRFRLEELKKEVTIIDFEFYNDTTISFLFVDINQQSYLFQFALENINQQCKYTEFNLFTKFEELNRKLNASIMNIKNEVKMGSDNEPIMQLRKLENIKVSNLAVSGSRKVACVSSISKKRVRVYEIDSIEDSEDFEEAEDF